MQARSKVGPHLNIMGNSDATQLLLRAEPSMGLGVNVGPPGEVASRDFIWVVRNYENDLQVQNPAAGGYPSDPQLAAKEYDRRYFQRFVQLNPWLKYLAGPNEPVVDLNVDAMKWCAAFFAELAAIIRVEYGLVPVIGNWSVGAPDFSMWQHYVPTLQALRRYGGYHARHSYGPLDEFYALRHRADNRIFSALGFSNVPTLLTEVGWEAVGGQWPWAAEPRRTEDEYVDYLATLNAELMRDSYVHGAAVFTHGLGWSNYSLNDTQVGAKLGDRERGEVFTLQVPEPVVAAPLPTPLEIFNVLDISKYQARQISAALDTWEVDIDMAAVRAAGARGVFIRTNDGDYRDPTTAEHLRRAKEAGIIWGYYFYHRTRVPATEQAELAFSIAGRPVLRPLCDVEEPNPSLPAFSEAYFAHVDEALRRTDALVGGVLGTTMIYSRQTWMDAHFTEAQQRRWSSVGRLGYWAHYNSAITKPWIPAGWKDEPFPVSEYALWQYTSTGTWPGVKRAVDIGRSRPGQDFNALLLNTDPQQPNPSPVPVPDTTHIVTASALNVRQWPWVGTLEPPKVGTPLVGGTAVKLFGVLPPIAGSPAGSFGWGLISAAGNQWVSMKYLAPK